MKIMKDKNDNNFKFGYHKFVLVINSLIQKKAVESLEQKFIKSQV